MSDRVAGAGLWLMKPGVRGPIPAPLRSELLSHAWRGTMFSLADQIASTGVGDGEVCLWWLGQAGFALKNHAGSVVYLDPYLSDAVERLHGFKRL